MATTILEDIKTTLGLLPDNLGFDLDLLIFVNSAKVNLVQLGVTEMNIIIDEQTQWPAFTNSAVGDLTKHYINAKARQMFDPIASETIAKTINTSVVELEGRLLHELEENP
jgi:hypothetical protein